jgi:hypothetical protein
LWIIFPSILHNIDIKEHAMHLWKEYME